MCRGKYRGFFRFHPRSQRRRESTQQAPVRWPRLGNSSNYRPVWRMFGLGTRRHSHASGEMSTHHARTRSSTYSEQEYQAMHRLFAAIGRAFVNAWRQGREGNRRGRVREPEMPRRPAVQGTKPWGGVVQIALVLAVSLSAWYVHWSGSTDKQRWHEVTDWMDTQGLQVYKDSFKQAGLERIEDIATLKIQNIETFQKLDLREQERLQIAAQNLQDELILKQWLFDYGLKKHLKWLKNYGIQSIEALAVTSDDVLKDPSSHKWLKEPWEHSNFVSSAHELAGHSPDFTTLKGKLWARCLRDSGATKWNIGGMILFALFIGALVVLVNMNYANLRNQNASSTPSKHSILEYVIGKYLATQYCKVFWDWDEPQTVGKTMTFKIKFYQRNGRPYPISNQDNVLVEIIHGNTKVPPTIQLGGTEAADVNSAKVAFTVHRAGEYRISIMVGAKHIRGSPFIRKFQAGPLDPSKTGFVAQSSVVVLTKGVTHQLVLEPRDEYGNLCTYAPEADHKNNYKITITETDTHRQWEPMLQVTYEKSTKRIMLNLTVDQEGCYQAVATYSGTPLQNAHFTILVLSETDAAVVKKRVAKKSPNVFYEARLLGCHYDKQQKAKKVYCYISPKQLTVKEFYLKIIPKRLFTFRVCPSTKFQFLGFNNQYDLPVFVVEDGCQPPVELAAKDRNIIAATFTTFLLKNIGGSETFKDKQDFFYHEVRQVHSKRIHEKLTLKINRHNLLEGSMKVTKHFSTSDWCKNFEIVFQGEEGLDWGGVRREWFELVCTELFDPSCTGLFHRFRDSNQALVHPSPQRPSHLKLKYYEFAGKMVGKCLYESALGGNYRQLVKARFTRSFLAQVIGLRVNYKYFEQDDPDLYVSKIKYIEENDVDDMELVFAEDEYKDGQLERVLELIPNGSKIPVTNKNKLKYLDSLAQFKLSNSVKDEIESFLKGLNELIPDNLLSIFDEYELELLMCGTGNYSITEFKEHHIIAGSSPEFYKVLEWFWTVVSGFTREEMARLLQFTTGCSQLPPGGFAELNPKFQITAAPTFGTLPTAHTCFNQLCLPDYDSIDHFHQALLVAVNEGSQGFGMI